MLCVSDLARANRRPLIAAFVLASLALLLVRAYVSRHPAGPLDVSLWYWHSPFRLARTEARELSALGVRRLFVRAGTISASGDGVELILRQTWQPSPGAPAVHLVFALDPGVVRHFEDLPNQPIARCIASSFVRQRQAAQLAGLSVLGVQIDFDCATRLLPKYADLLRRVRRELPRGTRLSITSLPTWFTSPDLPAVLGHVDFYCPQFYETRIGRVLSDARPVSDLRSLRDGLKAASRLGKPFYAGIPAYGHAFMFDDRGRLLGTYRGMSVLEAARHPSFRLARSWPADASGKPAAGPEQWVGEDFVDFVAIRPGAGGRGLGYHLLYSIPTARMVSLNLDMVRKLYPPACLGVIIFRSPEPGETMTLPMLSLASALRGREPHPSVRARVKTDSAPWGLVEGGASGPGASVYVSLTNTGSAGTFPARNSVALTLSFDAPGVQAESGGFDRVDCFSASGLRAGPARASVLVCTCSHLRVGETAVVGPIYVSGGARTMRGQWRVRTPGGFGNLRGNIDLVKLQEGTRGK